MFCALSLSLSHSRNLSVQSSSLKPRCQCGHHMSNAPKRTRNAHAGGENEITSDGAQLKQHAADSYERHSAARPARGMTGSEGANRKLQGLMPVSLMRFWGPIVCSLHSLRGGGEGKGHCVRNESTKEGRIGAITPLPPSITVSYHPTTLAVILPRLHVRCRAGDGDA